MNSDTLIGLWILVFPIGIIEVSTHVNFVFDFISVPYTITELQARETLYFAPLGAKLNDVKNVLFSSSKCEKRKSDET